MLAQLVGVVGETQQVEGGHLAGVQPRVPDGQAVGDDRRPGRPGLQARHAAGRVDEHVGRGQQLGHFVGEAEYVDPVLVREGCAELRVELLVAPSQADDAAHLGGPDELAHRARDVADAPAAAGDDDHPAVLGQPELAPRVGRAARLQELSGDQRLDEAHAALARDPLDRRHRLAVHDEVHVDARLRPEEEAGQVGDRRDGRGFDFAAPAQARQHDRDGRVGRDDHIRVVLGDRPCERPRAEQAQQPACHETHRQDVLEHPVDDRVGPREELQLHAIAVLDDGLQHAPHRPQAVDHRHLGRLGRGLDLLGQRACGGCMALADVRREDQHTARAVRIGNLAQSAFASMASHQRN